MKIPGLLMVLAAAAGCPGNATVPQVPVVAVKRSHFARTVDADGYLKAEKATGVTVPSEAEGPMRIAWLAADGVLVKKDEVVARFDDADVRSRLAGAEDDRSSAGLKKQKESLLVAQARDERERTKQAADRELALGRTFARKDPELYSRDDIIKGEIDESLQTAKADHARKAQTVDGQVARRKIQILAVEGQVADDLIRRAHKALRTLEVRAPHDGVLVLGRSWMNGEPLRVGDTVWRGQSLAEVPMVEKMEAEIFVLEAEAAGLVAGRKAEVTLESLPGRVWKATIKRVETVAKRRQYRSPTQYFGVTLSLDVTDPKVMKPGQRVRARLLLDEKDALVVPRPALFERDGKEVAYRRAQGGFKMVPVTLGISTAGLVVVESGLQDGDVIAMRDPGLALDDILTTPSGTSRKGH